MNVGGRSAFHKVGPNDAEPKHAPGRGQIKKRQRANISQSREIMVKW